VFRIPGYPGPPAPGPLQRPSFGQGVNRRSKPNKEDPHEEVPHEENDYKTAKDQKTSSRGVPHEGKDQIRANSAHSGFEREDKVERWHTGHATPIRGRPASACLHKAVRWLLNTPRKNRVDGAGRQGRMLAFLHPLSWTGATSLQRLRPPKTEFNSCPM
jgi:hypothetical protein